MKDGSEKGLGNNPLIQDVVINATSSIEARVTGRKTIHPRRDDEETDQDSD